MKWYIQKTQFEKEEFDTRNIFPDIFSTIEITGKEVKDWNTMEIHHYTDIYVPPFHICKW